MYGVRCNFIHRNVDDEEEKNVDKVQKCYREVLYEGKGLKESSLLKLLKNDF